MSAAIEQAFRDAVSEGVFPSAEALVAKNGAILHHGYYGDAREGICFDVASLTKPVSTAAIAMMLAAEGLLKLDDTVFQWLAGARMAAHKKMTAAMLLNHTSGLPAWQPYYRDLPLSLVGTEAGKALVLEECYSEPLIAEPGKETLYSDIGYMMLGEMLEQAGGATLDVLFSQFVARPLNLPDTFFVRTVGAPISKTSRHTDTSPDQHVPTSGHGRRSGGDERKCGEHRRFAATEDCPWRGRVIHGEVHDQNAYALGGVAGHAGLFSTAVDLHKFVSGLLNSRSRKDGWAPQDIVNLFIPDSREKPEGDTFSLGWSRPSKRASTSGRHFSANSIGHLGYTGCSIWADLDREFHVILLTNRIHPSSTNQKIKLFRPKIHDLIYKELLS